MYLLSPLVVSILGLEPSNKRNPSPSYVLSGLAKEFIVPGWRIGWLIVHDKGTGKTLELKAGLKSLTQIILGTPPHEHLIKIMFFYYRM
jgi:aspartate/methionine/tyrosine aminotransferase